MLDLTMSKFLIGIIAIVAVAAGSGDYAQSIRQWQHHREEGLRKADSWLTLVGLFWLKAGDNSIGTGEGNDFVLPKESSPKHVGKLTLSGGQVRFTPQGGTARVLRIDEDNPDIVRAGSASFYVIRRGDEFAVRAKDSESPVLKNFAGLKFFPINPALHFEARFVPGTKKIPILNILGQTESQESPGIVEFTYEGKQYHLRPIFEGKTLFFLFKDATNRTATYQAGRMLNTPLPADGKVDLDFNRAYNPPCTFTPYATCPLPPRENTLPFAVTAGELRYGDGHPEFTAKR
jgi:uncharacterized protein